jgi:hypothetical protein
MCGKLPGGSAGSVPSGSASAASGIGVPHHGGSIAAPPVLVAAKGTTNTRRSKNHLLSRRFKGNTS